MPSPRCPLCCATSTPRVTGHMPAPEKAIRLSRIFPVLVIALALLFALTSNDIISYITKNDLDDYVRHVYLHHAWPFLDTL